MTTYNITPVGQVANNDGILSNFSTSNYAYINNTLTPSSGAWYIEFDINITNSTFSGSQYFICSDEYGFGLGITYTNTLRMYYGDGSRWTSFNDSTITVSTGKYRIGCGWTGTKYYVNINYNNTYWQTDVCSAESSGTASTLTLKFGVAKANDAPFTNGSVDINTAVIISNNAELWTGVLWDTPVLPSTNYTWDITKVGSLVESDGWYAGFSPYDYLEMKSYPSSAITNLDIGIKFKTSSIIQNSCLIGQSTSNLTTPQIEIYSGAFYVELTDNNSSWNVMMATKVLCKSTDYFVNIKWDNSTQKVVVTLTNLNTGYISNLTGYSASGRDATASVVWSSLARLGLDITSNPWIGSIDLNKSYMKVNGSLLPDITEQQAFTPSINVGGSVISACYLGASSVNKIYFGSTLVYEEPSPAPVEPWYDWTITETGSLYNNNNSYVGFSSSDFLQMQDYPTSTINDLEIELRFTTSVTIANAVLMGQSTTNLTTPQIEIYNGQLCVDVTDNNSVWAAIIRTSAISPNTEYSLNVKWDSVSQDVTAILTDIASGTQTSLEPNSTQSRHTSAVNWSEVARLGVDITSGAWGGTIDLNNSYIKINGQYMGCSEGVGPKPQPSDEWIQTFSWGTQQISWNNPKTQTINVPADNVSHERLYKLVFNNATMGGSWAIVDYPYGSLATLNSMWWDSSWQPSVDVTPFSDTFIPNFTINPTSDTVYYRFTYNPSNDTKTFSVSRDKTNWSSVSGTGNYSAASNVNMMFMNRNNNYQTSGVYIDTTESYIKFGNRYMVKPYTT